MNTQPNQMLSSAAMTPGAPPVATRKGWFSRNWKWLVPTVLILFFVLPLMLIGSIFAAMKNSDAAKECLLRAQNNALVVERLGTPIEEGWLVSGSINTSTTSGDADLAVPISGPKGKGKVYVTAHKAAGAWDYQGMEVAIEGSDQRINLLSNVTPGAEFPATPPAPQLQPLHETPAGETQPASQPANPPAPTPAAAPTAAGQAGVIQTQETTYPGVIAEFTECRRKEGVLNIKVRFRNTSDKQVLLAVFRNDKEKYYVTAKNKKYFILKDSEGAYVAEDFGDWVPAGGSHTWWAKYPAPPADIKKITLLTQITTPFEDVPITDQ
jgi:Cytochrome oxidase complex assembly protein 1